jgi:hypothetical protein
VGSAHAVGQGGNKCCRVAGRHGRSVQFPGQSSALDVFHGEERPAVVFAAVINLNDVRVPQCCHRLGLAPEPLTLLRQWERTGKEHLEGDQPVEP